MPDCFELLETRKRNLNNRHPSVSQILLISQVFVAVYEDIKIAINEGYQLAILHPRPAHEANGENVKLSKAETKRLREVFIKKDSLHSSIEESPRRPDDRR